MSEVLSENGMMQAITGLWTWETFTAAILTVLVNILIVAIGYWRIQKAVHNRERDKFLRMLEDELMDIMDTRCVWLTDKPSHELVKTANQPNAHRPDLFRFRAAFGPFEWFKDFETSEVQTKINMYCFGDNYQLIGADGIRVQSHILQRVVLWFRRIDRLLTLRVLKPQDLVYLHRHIQPFARGSRYEYLRRLFSDEELASARRVIRDTFAAMQKRGLKLSRGATIDVDEELFPEAKELKVEDIPHNLRGTA